MGDVKHSPQLILTIGISGSGKSTYCQHIANESDNCVVISTDRMRGVIAGDERNQQYNGAVFETVHRMVEYFLRFSTKTVIVDATNYCKKNRKDFIEIGRRCNAEITAWVFPITVEQAKERNRQRERQVPDDVIDRQHSRLEFPVSGDEFDNVIYIGLQKGCYEAKLNP